MNINALLNAVLPSTQNMIACIVWLFAAAAALVFLSWTYGHTSLARFIAVSFVAIVGLLAWAIGLFDQLLPFDERGKWFVTGLWLTAVAGFWLTHTLQKHSRVKSKPKPSRNPATA